MAFSVSFLVLSAIAIIPLIVLAFLRTKMTKPFSFFMLLLVEGGIIFSIFKFGDMALWEKIVSTAINTLFVIIDLRLIMTSKIEFGNYQILSFSLIWNKLVTNPQYKNKKKVGTVIPYSMNNIKEGGRYIDFPEINGRGGMMITGAAGSGKTHQVLQLIAQDINNGNSVVYANFKGDKESSEKVAAIAKAKPGCAIYSLSLDEEYKFSFDPLFEMSPTGRVEAILNTRKWSMDGADAHFRTNTQLLIQKYIQAFDKVYANTESNTYTYDFYKFVMAHKPDLSNRAIADAYKTLETLLEITLTSDLGPSLKGEYNKEFSFKEAAEYGDQYVLIISIPSDSKEFANSLSSFYFRNLMSIATAYPFKKPVALYVDEFGTLENPFVIKDILEKGRSCGLMTTIIMQDIFQIVINTNEAYLNSLLGTVNNFLIFAGATREAAIKMAGVQIKEVEGILQTLMKPTAGSPTACFITKTPVLDKKKSSEVFKYVPYTIGSRAKLSNLLTKGDSGEGTSNADDDFYSKFDDKDSTSDFDEYMKPKEPKMTRKEKKKKDDDDFTDFLDDMGIF